MIPMYPVAGSQQPLLDAPLQSTLVLTKGTGSATYTRATTATIQDWNDVIKVVKSGEARFKGARRVENLATVQDASLWSVQTNVSITAGITDPLGGTTAYRITATSANAVALNLLAGITNGNLLRTSLYIKRVTGTGLVLMHKGTNTNVRNSTNAEDISYALDAVTPGTWQRFKPSVTDGTAATGTGAYYGVYLVTSGDEVDVCWPQLEDIQGQTVTAVGDFVDPATAHGAGAVGVQYFHTYPLHRGSALGDSFTGAQGQYHYTQLLSTINPSAQVLYTGDGSGTTLTTIAARYGTDVTPMGALNWLVLQGGINSVTSGHSLLTMQTAMSSMMDNAHNGGLIGRTYVANITPFRGASVWTQPREDLVIEWNAWLVTEVARRVALGQAIELWDIWTLLGDPADPFTLLPFYANADWLHPSLYGYAAMGIDLSAKVGTGTTTLITPANVGSAATTDAGGPFGFLSEPARTNHFLNSGVPATQTSASLGTGLYTLSMRGTGSVAVAQNSATITGAGTATAAASVTFTVTVAGTVDYTVTGSPTYVQSENGGQQTSYIPTVGSAVVRNVDICWYTATGNHTAGMGAFGVDINLLSAAAGATQRALSLSDNTLNNEIYFAVFGMTVPFMFVQAASVGQASLDVGAVVSGVTTRLRGSWIVNDIRASQDNGTVVKDAVATIPTGLTHIGIGNFVTAGASALGGTVRKIKIYPRPVNGA